MIDSAFDYVREADGRKAFTYHTPHGTITRVDRLASDGSWSRQEFYIKTPEDLPTRVEGRPAVHAAHSSNPSPGRCLRVPRRTLP